jgi:hypothetical protein
MTLEGRCEFVQQKFGGGLLTAATRLQGLQQLALAQDGAMGLRTWRSASFRCRSCSLASMSVIVKPGAAAVSRRATAPNFRG